jgi:hypothetical protein
MVKISKFPARSLEKAIFPLKPGKVAWAAGAAKSMVATSTRNEIRKLSLERIGYLP